MSQGIHGMVKEESGNRMPGPGRELPPPIPVKTTIYVYEPTSLSQVESANGGPVYTAVKSKLIKSVETDEKGSFRIALPPGTYSLFAKVEGGFFANSFDGNNRIHPVVVEEDKFTEVDILINHKAVY